MVGYVVISGDIVSTFFGNGSLRLPEALYATHHRTTDSAINLDVRLDEYDTAFY